MLTIRFARVGKKNKAQFKIMLQEKTAAPGGRHVEILGAHDPHLKKTVLKEERIKYWLSQGAQASDTVHNLLVSKGVISGEKRRVKVLAKKVEEAPVVEVAAEAPKEEVKVEEAKTETAEAPKEEAKAEEPKKEE
jgi:small subunit ribosomal protein S16